MLEVCTAVQLAYNEVNWLNKISVAEQFVLEVEMFNCIGNNMHIYTREYHVICSDSL